MRKNKKLRGAMVLLGCLLLQAVISGLFFNTQSLFLAPVCAALGFSVGEISTCRSAVGILSALMLPIVGRLLDHRGFKWVLCAASAGLGVTLLLTQYCTGLLSFCMMTVLQSVFCCFLGTLPIPLMINNWFHRNTGVLLSITPCSSGIVGGVASPIIAGLMERYSWKFGYLLVGMTVLVVGVFCSVFLLERRPEDIGMTPFGDGEEKLRSPEGPETATLPSQPIRPNGKTLIFSVYVVCVYAVMTFASGHLANFATDLGYTATMAALFNTCLMGGNIVSKLLMGPTIDRFSARTAALISLGAAFAGFVIFYFQFSLLFYPASALSGFIHSLVAVVMTCLVRQYFSENSFSEVYSLFAMVGTLSSSLFNGLVGTLFDRTGGYHVVLLVCLGLIFLGGVCLLLIEPSRRLKEQKV